MMASSALLFAILNLLAVAHGQGRGALRLYRNGATSTSYTSGILEMYYSGWGNVCDDSDFSGFEANVACHQLGYSGYSNYGSSGFISSYGTDSRSTVIDNVDCSTSSYLALLQCSYSTIISLSCTNYYDAYVSCYSTRIWNNPYSGQIRLIGGSYAGQGLLEVYCNGQWGTVCDDNFGLTDANVACRQLGYSDNYNYDRLFITGTSSQPIWLTNVPCISSYTSCLATCGSSCPSSQISNCVHSEDMTLECEFSSSYATPSTTLSTCQYADTSNVINTYTSSIGGIVGGVIAASVIICILSIAIPLCICFYLGVGIGAACKQSNQRPNPAVIATPMQPQTTLAVVVSSQQQQQVPPPSYGYEPPPAYPAAGYAPDTAYLQKQQPYPAQQPYPSPQAGYPPPYPQYT